MPLSEFSRINDSVSATAMTAVESAPAHFEAWTSMKEFVISRIASRMASKVAPTVIIGDASWGGVNLSRAPGDVVEGLLDGERTSMHQTAGKQFFGDIPWGSTNLAFKDGHLSGKGPWGDVSLKVTAQDVSGDVPWGKIHLTLIGQNLSGPTPWGTAHLRLGDKYHSLTNPDVLMGLSAIFSNK